VPLGPPDRNIIVHWGSMVYEINKKNIIFPIKALMQRLLIAIDHLQMLLYCSVSMSPHSHRPSLNASILLCFVEGADVVQGGEEK
jgi:hypothetical protein